MTATVALPTDQAVRDVVATDLARTLFVEAGAGSGKTTVLVDRVCALVESGIDVRKIAAITFTEKAAAELRSRVREELDEPRAPQPAMPRSAVLGEAPMSTLHAFARRLLTQHGLAVGVPPRFEVLDEVGEAIYLEDEVARARRRAVRPEGPARRGRACGPSSSASQPGRIREIVFALHQSYDRLRESDRVWEWPAEAVDVAPVDMSSFLQRVVDARAPTATRCSPSTSRARRRPTSNEARIDILRTEGVLPKQEVRASREDGAQGAAVRPPQRCDHGARARARRLGARHGPTSARREGALLFHDLLVLARDALRHDDVRVGVPRGLRAHPHRRVPGHRPAPDRDRGAARVVTIPTSRHASGTTTRSLPDDAGRLFFVGDPKQSIYRFRRADVELYRHAQEVFADPPLHLTENFRTVESIVEFVNGLFSVVDDRSSRRVPARLRDAHRRTSPITIPARRS